MNAREAALTVLYRCRRGGAWSGASVDSVIKEYELDRREASLACAIVLGVIENSRLLDFYIDFYCSQNAKKLEPQIRDILRMGMYQLLFLDKIPARAAVNETVELCKSAKAQRASSLVNAVLRKFSGSLDSLPEIPGDGTPEYLAVKYSHPDWLAKRLMLEKGYDFAKAFFEQNNAFPDSDIQINTLHVTAQEYEKALIRENVPYKKPAFPDNCFCVSHAAIASLPGYEEGLFYVQDRAAKMAVQLACPVPGMNVLDACAAPGGKSLACAIMMNDTGSILSCDISDKKLRLIEENASRIGISCIDVLKRDAREHDIELAGKFDIVIADVPCSGFGVIRKKPEIRFKSEAEIAGLPDIQLDILCKLSACVKAGGTLIYSTCTVLSEENEAVVQSFLKGNHDFTPENFMVGERCSENGMYTFWPNVDGTDGFFAAKLKRNK